MIHKNSASEHEHTTPIKMNIQLSKLAIVYNPPTLIVEYIRRDMNVQKPTDSKANDHDNHNNITSYRHRKFNFQSLLMNSNGTNVQLPVAEDVAEELIDDYPMFFQSNQGYHDKLVQLLKKLFLTIYRYNNDGSGTAERMDGKESTSQISTQTCNDGPSLIPECFGHETNEIDNDPNKIVDCPIQPTQNLSSSFSSSSSSLKFDDVSSTNTDNDDGMIESIDDLNKVCEKTLEVAKEKMNVTFTSNRIVPGQEGYEYDKRVDYEVISESSWD